MKEFFIIHFINLPPVEMVLHIICIFSVYEIIFVSSGVTLLSALCGCALYCFCNWILLTP